MGPHEDTVCWLNGCARVLINWTDLHQQVIAGDEL